MPLFTRKYKRFKYINIPIPDKKAYQVMQKYDGKWYWRYSRVKKYIFDSEEYNYASKYIIPKLITIINNSSYYNQYKFTGCWELYTKYPESSPRWHVIGNCPFLYVTLARSGHINLINPQIFIYPQMTTVGPIITIEINNVNSSHINDEIYKIAKQFAKAINDLLENPKNIVNEIDEYKPYSIVSNKIGNIDNILFKIGEYSNKNRSSLERGKFLTSLNKLSSKINKTAKRRRNKKLTI